MISVTDVSRYYGDFLAVDNISFSIRDGEITGLLGPNGAGKTTTMRMLTGYLKASNGNITVGDFNAEKDPLEIRKILGYLPESAPIYGDMIVFDFLKYIADIRGVNDPLRIAEMGELCGINQVMHKNVNELSKGYKQRVGLAQAMIHDPEILILDEPTSGLDPNQIVEIRNLIKEIGKKKTVILSTHILPEVEATCDRVIIIDRGRIVADDRTDNLQNSADRVKNIELTVSGADFTSVSEKLRTIEGVTDVREVQGASDQVSLIVSAGMTTELRPDIFRMVAESGWVMYEMKQEQQSLEKVFRQLTAGGNNVQA